jgi:hypothetical protein
VDEFLDRGLDERCELLGGRDEAEAGFDHSGMQAHLLFLLVLFFGKKRIRPSLDVRIGEDVACAESGSGAK